MIVSKNSYPITLQRQKAPFIYINAFVWRLIIFKIYSIALFLSPMPIVDGTFCANINIISSISNAAFGLLQRCSSVANSQIISSSSPQSIGISLKEGISLIDSFLKKVFLNREKLFNK